MLRYVVYMREYPWDPKQVVGQAGSEMAAKSIIASFCEREMRDYTLMPYKNGFTGTRRVNYDMDIKDGTNCYIWYEDTEKES